MTPQYEPKIEHNGHLYYPPPFSLLSLDDRTRTGMLVLASNALLSVVATASMITFMIYRFVQYRLYSKAFAGPQQYLVLVMNLLLADFQQSLGFVIGFHWIQENGIFAPTAACFSQAWFLNVGDVSSGLFVFLIAIHTFATAACGKRVSPVVFATAIFSVWLLAFFFSGIGVIIHGGQFFVKAATWCWIASMHEKERLFFHYFWIFVSEFGSVVLYVITFLKLRRTTQQLKQARIQDHHRLETIRAVNRISILMMLYPLAYIICTLPVSIGRMWTMAHASRPWSEDFGTAGAALLTSCGWIDVMLYTLTRRRLMSVLRPRQASEELGSVGAGDGGPTTQLPTTYQDSGKGLQVELVEFSNLSSSNEAPSPILHKANLAVREQEKQARHPQRAASPIADPHNIPFMPPNPTRQDVVTARTDPREYRRKNGFHLSRMHDLPRPAHLNPEKNQNNGNAHHQRLSTRIQDITTPTPPIVDPLSSRASALSSHPPTLEPPREKDEAQQQWHLSQIHNFPPNSKEEVEGLGLLPPAYSSLGKGYAAKVGGEVGWEEKGEGDERQVEGKKEWE